MQLLKQGQLNSVKSKKAQVFFFGTAAWYIAAEAYNFSDLNLTTNIEHVKWFQWS